MADIKTPAKKQNARHSAVVTVQRAPVNLLKHNVHSLIAIFRDKHKALFVKANYFSAKSVVTPPLDDELKTLRGMIRAGLGTKPIHIRMVQSFIMTATVTSGVVNTVVLGGGNNRILTSDFTENSGLAALFDEVKVTHGFVEFLYLNPVYSASIAAATISSLPVIAYDPTGATSASSATNARELAQHHNYDPPLVTAAIGANQGAAQLRRVRFDWKVPPGTVLESGLTVNIGADWMDANDPVPVGYIKHYHIGSTVTAVDVAGGSNYALTQWRSRA